MLMSLEKEAIRYPQPHNINDFDCVKNVALREYLINKSHHRQKYESKYLTSKKSKRNPKKVGCK